MIGMWQVCDDCWTYYALERFTEWGIANDRRAGRDGANLGSDWLGGGSGKVSDGAHDQEARRGRESPQGNQGDAEEDRGDIQGAEAEVHESINIASAFDLPVIYICENNLYGVGTYQPKVRGIEDIADRAAGYGIPGVIADGNDIMAVYNATAEAAQRARKGKGPTLLEFKTYRWYPHFEGDKDPRPPEEVASWKEKEPINRFRKVLFKDNILDVKKNKEIIDTIKEEVRVAVKFAHESKEPELSEALTDVYKQ